MNLTYREIKDQYSALRKTFNYITNRKDEIINFFKEKSPVSLTYIGCGSGYCLCQSAEFSARVRLGMPASAIAGGDLMLNYELYKNILKDTILIAPSRSGSTSEIIKSIQLVKSVSSVPVMAISCVEDSDLSKISDLTLELPWAFDNSVCQTRTVTNLYTANLLIIAYVSNDLKLISDIDMAIELGSTYMDENEEKIRKLAYRNWNNVVILADGELQGIASEGAMAFTEIANIPAHYFHRLDVRHGPMTLINESTLVIACITSNGFDYQRDLINQIVKKGAKVVTYSDLNINIIEGVELAINSGVNLDIAACGIPFIFISQMISYYKAEKEGINPDAPDGLTAWVNLN